MERSRRGGGGWTVRQREWRRRRWCQSVRVGAGGDRGVEPKLLHGEGGWGGGVKEEGAAAKRSGGGGARVL